MGAIGTVRQINRMRPDHFQRLSVNAFNDLVDPNRERHCHISQFLLVFVKESDVYMFRREGLAARECHQC